MGPPLVQLSFGTSQLREEGNCKSPFVGEFADLFSSVSHGDVLHRRPLEPPCRPILHNTLPPKVGHQRHQKSKSLFFGRLRLYTPVPLIQ